MVFLGKKSVYYTHVAVRFQHVHLQPHPQSRGPPPPLTLSVKRAHPTWCQMHQTQDLLPNLIDSLSFAKFMSWESRTASLPEFPTALVHHPPRPFPCPNCFIGTVCFSSSYRKPMAHCGPSTSLQHNRHIIQVHVPPTIGDPT